MSYYRTVTVYHLPERREEGIDKIKLLRKLLNEYGAPTEILVNSAGGRLHLHVVSRFETIAQFETLNSWATIDEAYQSWLQSVQSLFDWNRTETKMYRTL